MGAQDSLAQAEDFLASTGATTPTMIWDESFSTWQYYGVSGQPAALLVNATGEPIRAWLGAFDVNEVLDLARSQ